MGEVKIVRSKRKTISLQITQSEEIVVRAPLRISDSFIWACIQKNSDWITMKKAEMRKKKSYLKQYVDGEEFLYLGNCHKLVRTRHSQDVILKEGIFYVGEKVANPKGAFEKWYKKRAHELIGPRVYALAQAHDFAFNSIRITSARTRWGSCSGKKNLSFSWRLMMAPHEVIDYVIVHELTHLNHMNHSKRFWNDVGKLCPHYMVLKKWLTTHAKNTLSV